MHLLKDIVFHTLISRQLRFDVHEKKNVLSYHTVKEGTRDK